MTSAQAQPSGSGYANPDVLVSTDWVAQHLKDPNIRIVESNEDVLLYDLGHVPGAVKVDWHTDLQQPLTRDFIDTDDFVKLMARLGIGNDTTIVFYGDKNNWWAAYAYWFFRYMGHDNVKIMDGGRTKGEKESRAPSGDEPQVTPTNYAAATPHPELRAYRDEVLQHIGYERTKKTGEGKPLVD